MHFALIQLPLLDPNYSALKANVPLASGYLASNLCIDSSEGGPPRIEIPPRELTDYGGDRSIIDWITENKFDLVGFTCYMWNVERNIWIASRLKERIPSIFIAAGGPEIEEGCRWLAEPCIDTFVIGEGEGVFPVIVSQLAAGKRPERVYRPLPIKDLSTIRNPYMAFALKIRENEPIPFEMTRGCPFGCTYCYYSKTRHSPRVIPESLVRDFFSFASAERVQEIYLMDPSLASGSLLHEKLQMIRAANTSHIPLHAEINLESVDEKIACLLKEAGFASVEAGLQSTNPAALRAVKRHFDERLFIRGAALLKEQGIKLTVGIILGLPLDTLEGFSDTCDFILEHSLADGVEIYPLSVLPGTKLRENAPGFGLVSMDAPPYWVLETPHFPREDFLRASSLVSEKLGLELFHNVMPRFSNMNRFKSFIDARSNPNETAMDQHNLANNCTILISPEILRAGGLKNPARSILAENPFACIQLALRSDESLPDDFFMETSDLFFRPNHYIERIHCFDDDNQGRFGTRIFQLTTNTRLVQSLLDSYSFADPILLYKRGSLGEIETFLNNEKPLVVIDSKLPDKELSGLKEIYGDRPEYLILSKYNIG